MNNFEAKYIKISSSYLNEKIKELQVKSNKPLHVEDKKESTIQKIVTEIFSKSKS